MDRCAQNDDLPAVAIPNEMTEAGKPMQHHFQFTH